MKRWTEDWEAARCDNAAVEIELTPPHVLIFICNFNKTIFLCLGLAVGRWTLIGVFSGYQSFCRLMYWVFMLFVIVNLFLL
jgi:hypothetical protein